VIGDQRAAEISGVNRSSVMRAALGLKARLSTEYMLGNALPDIEAEAERQRGGR
jgi:hypothetical protein